MADTEADAAEESRVNVELANQLSLRLDSSRRASERLLGIFQVLCRCCSTEWVGLDHCDREG